MNYGTHHLFFNQVIDTKIMNKTIQTDTHVSLTGILNNNKIQHEIVLKYVIPSTQHFLTNHLLVYWSTIYVGK